MEHRRVIHRNRCGVVQHNNLRYEVLHNRRGVPCVAQNVSACYVFLVYSPYIEADIVPWNGLCQLLVVHFNCFYFAAHSWGVYYYRIPWLHYSSFYPSNRNCSYSFYVVNILYWQSQWLVCRWLRRNYSVKGLNKCRAFVPSQSAACLFNIVPY